MRLGTTFFAEYEKAEEKLAKVYEIQSKKEFVGALDTYKGLYGMLFLMKGDPNESLKYFDERISVQNNTYYAYFKDLQSNGSK